MNKRRCGNCQEWIPTSVNLTGSCPIMAQKLFARLKSIDTPFDFGCMYFKRIPTPEELALIEKARQMRRDGRTEDYIAHTVRQSRGWVQNKVGDIPPAKKNIRNKKS